MSLSFVHKVIQDALFYNKIECYNKGVQRNLSLSKRLHSLLEACSSLQVQDVWKGAKEGLRTVVTIESWLHHDAWRKHRKNPSLIKNNGVSWGQNVAEPSDYTWPTDVGHDPSLMNISTTRKSSNEHGLLVDVTFGVRLVKGGFETLQVTSSFPWPARGPYSPPYPLWPWQTRGIAGASYPMRSWRMSSVAQILVSHKQEPWLLLQCLTIKRVH